MIDQSAQIQRLLTEAISAARAGDNKYARPLLRRVVSLDPNNEQAWLWLSQVGETPRERMQALEQVLQINPENTAAQRGLTLLREQAERPTEPLAPGETPSTMAGHTQGPMIAPLSPMEELRPMIEASRKRKSTFRPSEIIIFLIGLVLIWLVARVALDLLIPAVPERTVEPEGQLTPWRQVAQSGLPLALPLLCGRQLSLKATALAGKLKAQVARRQLWCAQHPTEATDSSGAPVWVVTQTSATGPGELRSSAVSAGLPG